MVRCACPRFIVPALLLFACGGGAPGVPGPVEGPRFTVLLVAEAPGRPYAAPFARNGLGETVGTAGPEAWHPLNVPILVEPNGTATVLQGDMPAFAFGVNDAGLVVGESGRLACAWESGARRLLKLPDFAGSGSAHAVNTDGLIVGSYGDFDDGIGPTHCAWASLDAEPRVLEGLGKVSGSAWAVNASGAIAGVSGGVEGEFFSVRWDGVDAAPVRIGPLPGAMNSEARAINAGGDVAGRSSFADGRTQAFLHRRATNVLEALPFLPGGAGERGVGVEGEGDGFVCAPEEAGVEQQLLGRVFGRAAELGAAAQHRQEAPGLVEQEAADV